jgi:putative membrane protein
MRFFVWLLRAFIFFALFAFALNNQQTATVHWFFGVQWRAPMVILVLVAFAGGCAIGVLAMLPSWWRHRRTALRLAPPPAPPAVPPATSIMPSEFGAEHPPRVGP